MNRIFSIVSCLVLLCAMALAQEDNKKSAGAYNFLIGASDTILVATVTNIQRITQDLGDTTGLPRNNHFSADLQVDKMLKGRPVEKINIKFYTFDKNPGLEAEAQKIFFLRRVKGGYAFANYYDVRDADQEDTIAKAIKDFPVKLKLEKKLPTFFFDKPVELELLITNDSASPIEISQQYSLVVESYILSPMFVDLLPVTQRMMLPEVEEPVNAEGPAVTRNITIGAGEDYTAKLKVTYSIPQSWQFLTKETYLQMPVALRFVVRSNVMRDNDNKVIPNSQYQVSTSWMTAMVGYPLPREAGEFGDADTQ